MHLTLPDIFSDHAVLQRSARTPVWGTAAPGETVALTLGDLHASATAGADGKWRADLDLSKADDGPFTLVVEGRNRIEVEDVVVGEVWLASGQSNMEFTLDREIHAATEIPRSSDPGLRQFLVTKTTAVSPAPSCSGKWIVAGPGAAPQFSAVGHYFGGQLRRTLRTPVGLILSAWGGTAAESWTSSEALATVPALGGKAAQLEAVATAYPALLDAYAAALHVWQEKFRRQLPAPPDGGAPQAAPEAPGEWTPVSLPCRLADGGLGLPDAGAVWLRRAVDLTARDREFSFAIEVPGGAGTETVYWNGLRIGGGTPENPPPANHRYYIPLTAMKEKDNVLAIRLANPASGLALGTVPYLLNPAGTVLSGGWTAQAEIALPPLPATAEPCPVAPALPVVPQLRGSTLYNGMIAPLIPYAIAGTIWYQGEQNTASSFQYRFSFPLMIGDWRRRWGWDFPFYFCQLPNYQAKAAQPMESSWAELRESQMKALVLPHTGVAVLIDAGEEADIHPKDKTVPGERLARLVLAKSYHQPVVGVGPIFRRAAIEGNEIRVTFEEGGGRLVASPLPADYAPSSLLPERVPLVRNLPESELEGFALCGADRRWLWAHARIDGAAVRVWSPQVSQPVAVRYAWGDNPTCNLYNHAGLPAAPFRSDDFPLSTEQATW